MKKHMKKQLSILFSLLLIFFGVSLFSQTSAESQLQLISQKEGSGRPLPAEGRHPSSKEGGANKEKTTERKPKSA
jgi:hypothetical protein